MFFPRAVLGKLEHGVCFFHSAQAKYLATNSVGGGILGLGGSVYKYLGLKKAQRPEWNSSSTQPVVWIQMHFFKISLIGGKNKVFNLKIGF